MARVLVIGQGGREHALCWRLHSEGHEVHVAPGNDGTESVAIRHAEAVHGEDQLRLAERLGVDLVVVGPEQPLVEGLADTFRAAAIPTFGPSARAAELEGSKAVAKRFMRDHGIPTARYEVASSLDEGIAALRTFASAPVVKADGLAAGKGVTVCESMDEAESALRECFSGRFGTAGARVVLEERLVGQEVSVFAATDGRNVALFVPAQDHKRIGEGDTGPNTGGMGAYVPAPVFTPSVRDETLASIVRPTIAGLAAEGRPFVGVVFFGLMVDPAGRPSVIEYNCRFGDPETQSLMLGLEDPLFPVLHGAATGTLAEGFVRGRPAVTVVLASRGYPESSSQGDLIEGLERVAAMADVQVFHAGTRRNAAGGWETAGGRVLGVSARADTLGGALQRAYEAVDVIRFEGMQLRRDIGHRAR